MTGLHISIIFVVVRIMLIVNCFLVVDSGSIGAFLLMREKYFRLIEHFKLFGEHIFIFLLEDLILRVRMIEVMKPLIHSFLNTHFINLP